MLGTSQCLLGQRMHISCMVELKMHTIHVYSKVKNMDTVNVLKFQTNFNFLFSIKMLVFCAEIKKMLVRMVNREGLNQTACF